MDTIVVVDVDDAAGTKEDQVIQKEPNVSTGATWSSLTAQAEHNINQLEQHTIYSQLKKVKLINLKQSNNFKASSFKVKEKDRLKKIYLRMKMRLSLKI